MQIAVPIPFLLQSSKRSTENNRPEHTNSLLEGKILVIKCELPITLNAEQQDMWTDYKENPDVYF